MVIENTRLADILSYKNENVISRFLDMFTVTEEEADDIFCETKKFIYLCSMDKDAFISEDMLIIDEMWHNFILFTPDYKHFCDTYFNRFIHHVPSPKKEKETYATALIRFPEETKQQMLDKIEHMMSVTYDHFDEDTVVKWFSIYPQKFTKEYIKAIRK
jgi:hypothetical protein